MRLFQHPDHEAIRHNATTTTLGDHDATVQSLVAGEDPQGQIAFPS